MKKTLILALGVLALIIFTSCEEESSDPPEFTNGLLVNLIQNPENSSTGYSSENEFTARQYVGCNMSTFNVVTFTAKTSENEQWKVKFQWDENDADSIFYISEGPYNEISLISENVGNYLINASNDNADQTYIKVLRLKRDEIIEAEFEGYIFKTGGSLNPDSLKEGYLITKTFVIE
jgi:hypothetical protein